MKKLETIGECLGMDAQGAGETLRRLGIDFESQDIHEIVRQYIQHVRAECKGRMVARTQEEIAAHLDMSQQACSDMLRRLGVDWKTTDLSEIRMIYIEHLRKMAGRHRAW